MDSDLIRQIAGAVRTHRLAQGLSQEDLAQASGLDRTYISGVERGVRNITLASLEQILLALNVQPRTFFAAALSASKKP